MRKKSLLFFILAAVGVLISAVLILFYLAYGFLASSGSKVTREVIYEVSPAKSFNSVAKDLQNQGVVKNAEVFSIYARLTGQRGRMKVGEYQFNTSMKPIEVLSILTSGRSISRPFTVSEGLNIFEIASLYERSGFGKANDFLAIVRDPRVGKSLLGEEASSLEGYLFPETYQITKFTSTRELIAAMVRRFLVVYREIQPELEKHSSMSRHQLVTLASIVEKETGAPEERPLISSVFHNRMKKGIRLQTDPTIIYGIAVQAGIIPKNISRADILRPTVYNTYVIKGLPPGPISNPGRDALIAAAKPAVSDYLFFVSRNDGTHVFSQTYADHNRAVRSFQLNPKSREGRSWRDLRSRGTSKGP
jgi:UPF0755 protein